MGPISFFTIGTAAANIFASYVPLDKEESQEPTLQCVTETEELDLSSLEETTIIAVIDGDTIRLPADICEKYGVPVSVRTTVKGDKPGCSARIKGINTTEKRNTRKRRTEKEKGALAGWEFLEQMVLHQKVFVEATGGTGGYGRLLVTRMYTAKEIPQPEGQKPKTVYVDVLKRIIQEGHAHVCVYAPDTNKLLPEYMPCQREAQEQKKGLWAFPEYQGTFNMTSIHTNGRNTSRFPPWEIKCKEDEHPNCEYFRLTNTSGKTVDLGQYKLKRYTSEGFGHEEKIIPLPSCKIPPGMSVQIFSGKAQNETDYNKGELVVFLGQEKEFWPDSGACVIVIGPDGKTETFRPSRKNVDCPAPNYRK